MVTVTKTNSIHAICPRTSYGCPLALFETRDQSALVSFALDYTPPFIEIWGTGGVNIALRMGWGIGNGRY